MIYDIANKDGIRRLQERTELLIKRASEKKSYRVEIKAIHKQRTNLQNRYLHLIITLYGIETGHTLDEAKVLIKRELGYTYVKNDQQYFRQTSKMDTKELTDFIDKLRNWSSKQGIYLPAPNERLDELVNYIESNKQWI